MTSSSAIHVSAGDRRIAVLHVTLRAMKNILFVLPIVALMLGVKPAPAQAQTSPIQTCSIIDGGDAGPGAGVNPTYLADQTGQANEGCTVLITLNADGTITITAPNAAPSYDNGADDNVIGVANNTGNTITSLQLSSAAVDIFGFDHDGLCGGPPGWTFNPLGPLPNCAGAQDPNLYGQGPVTFTVTNTHLGVVNFGNGGIPTNTVSYFSLEGGNLIASLQVKIPDPKLVFQKSGPATMALGQWGAFGLNVQNTGGSDAWNVTIVDKLPTGANGGMCAVQPQILSARVYQSDGVTPVPGKGPLAAGTDYTVSYAGAPACTLILNLLSPAAVISPTQRLIITYQTQLDANTKAGVALTNVAGATQWYNAQSSNFNRQTYTCTLTNGTPGVLDCQDAHTVMVVAPVVSITKQVTVVGGGQPVAGATLDYLVHVTNTSANPVTPVVITDDLNAAGPGYLTYVAGTATMNALPNGVSVAGNVIIASYSATYGPLASKGTIDLHFRATLGGTLAPGTTVTNTAVVTWNNPPQTASASVSIKVAAPQPPALTLTKGGPPTMYVGQLKPFTLNVQNIGMTDAWNATIVDKLPTGATGGMCTMPPQILSAQVFQADGVTPVPGKGPLTAGTDYTVIYAGAPTCTLTLNLLTAAAVISPTLRRIVIYQTQLDANTQKGVALTNVAGATQWYDAPVTTVTRKTYTCALTNGTPGVLDCQDAHTVTVPISALTMTKGGTASLYPAQLGTFTLNVQNTGNVAAWNATIIDKLPRGATGGMCATPPKILSVQLFLADGVTPVPGSGALKTGTDYTVMFAPAPVCILTINLVSAATVINPTQRLIVTYQAQLDPNPHIGATLTNVAGTTQWYTAAASDPNRQSSTCTVTNGTPGVLDCQDAHNVTVVTAGLTITKQVSVVGTGLAAPGSSLDYLVHVANTSANTATPVVITDDLNAAGPGVLTYVVGSATVNGSVVGVTVIGNVITVNYSVTYGPLIPGATIDLRFRVTVSRTVPTGTSVTNTGVVTWNNPPQTASASVSVLLDTPPGALTVSKTTPLVDVTRGQLIPYTIVVTNVLTGPVQGAALVDSFPAGFRYVPGSARLDDVPTEPTMAGLQLTWTNLNFAGGAHHTIMLLLAVGAGVGEGQFVNRAQAFDVVAGTASKEQGHGDCGPALLEPLTSAPRDSRHPGVE